MIFIQLENRLHRWWMHDLHVIAGILVKFEFHSFMLLTVGHRGARKEILLAGRISVARRGRKCRWQ